jgi:endonuclease/exonuclease/phosphatase family metal-dependent hydrolase
MNCVHISFVRHHSACGAEQASRSAVCLCCFRVLLLLLNGSVCASETDGTFSVMTYNVHEYALTDRDGDGEADDPKPESECRAVVRLIAAQHPDILTVQEMGDSSVFEQFRRELLAAGLDYPYAELLQRGRMEINLAVLSRFPIVSVQHRTNEWYSIGDSKVPVARGFLDVEIQVNPQYRFRLLAAHLKSKVYSPLGQTEMRRNEARLLNKVIREILEKNPETNLLAAGDFNDDYNSAPVREVSGRRGGPMTDLRPADSVGDVWTYFWPSTDGFSRFDYLFVSDGMLREVIREQTRVVRDPLTGQASDHRPVMAVFRAAE